MEKFRDWIYRFSQMVEIAIAVLIGLMIFVVLVKTCVFSFSSLAAAKADYVEVFTEFLSIVLELVIGIEFIRVLCRHSVKALLEVVMFAIAREMIVVRLETWQTFVGVAAIVLLFAARKYLLEEKDQEDAREAPH